MRILMVAAEAAPFVSTGNVGEVLRSLPRALVRLGHQVDVVIPRYRGVACGEPLGTIRVALGGQVEEASLSAVVQDGVRTVLVGHAGYFERDYLYGAPGHDYPDNPERVAFLDQAALTWAVSAGSRYDIVHGHDWQAGLVPVLLGRMFRAHASLTRVPAIFTIHNLAYQGIYDASWLPRLGLGWELMRSDALEYWNRISLLKAGIVFSRFVTVPSPHYAEEIQTPELGLGFDGILRARAPDLVGILNGIDYDQWDPAPDRDPGEPCHASKLAESRVAQSRLAQSRLAESRLAGKDAAKRQVLAAFGLPVTPATLERPLVAIATPLVDGNGFDLLASVADALPGLGASVVLQGHGQRHHEDLWLAMSLRHPDVVGMKLGDDGPLAHAIQAGADLLLMPARQEPSGVQARVSLHYGTVPLVRASGGMSDTVRNYDARSGEGNGFVFEEYSAQALLGTLRWALDVFRDRQTWRRIQAAGMRPEYSWDESAKHYTRLYERAATQRVWQ